MSTPFSYGQLMSAPTQNFGVGPKAKPMGVSCPRCGKTALQPDSIHTCTPLALKLADALEEAAQRCDDLWQDDGTAYDCRESIRAMKGKQT